jgi:circadian clock protein KaiC
MYLKTKGLSSILTWDSSQLSGQGFQVSEQGMSFLADCIILLRFVEIESSVRKAITIMKMRGSNHDKLLREYEITNKGIVIGRSLAGYEGLTSGVARRVTQSIDAVLERIDEVLPSKGKKQPHGGKR